MKYLFKYIYFFVFMVNGFLLSCTTEGGSEWETFQFVAMDAQSVWASSALDQPGDAAEGIFSAHGPQKLVDGDTTSWWAEGEEGDGEGVTIDFLVTGEPDRIGIWNGNQEDSLAYLDQDRPRSLRLRWYAGFYHPALGGGSGIARVFEGVVLGRPEVIELADRMGMQPFPGGLDWKEKDILLEGARKKFQGRYGAELARLSADPSRAEEVLILRLELGPAYAGFRHDRSCLSEIRLLEKSGEGGS